MPYEPEELTEAEELMENGDEVPLKTDNIAEETAT